jgi:hypothetical protein
MTRGGYRKNAGRPRGSLSPTHLPPTTQVRVSESAAETLRHEAGRRRSSVRAIVDELVEGLRREPL